MYRSEYETALKGGNPAKLMSLLEQSHTSQSSDAGQAAKNNRETLLALSLSDEKNIYEYNKQYLKSATALYTALKKIEPDITRNKFFKNAEYVTNYIASLPLTFLEWTIER